MADIKTIVDHSFGYDSGPLALIDEVRCVCSVCLLGRVRACVGLGARVVPAM